MLISKAILEYQVLILSIRKISLTIQVKFINLRIQFKKLNNYIELLQAQFIRKIIEHVNAFQKSIELNKIPQLNLSANQSTSCIFIFKTQSSF